MAKHSGLFWLSSPGWDKSDGGLGGSVRICRIFETGQLDGITSFIKADSFCVLGGLGHIGQHSGYEWHCAQKLLLVGSRNI